MPIAVECLSTEKLEFLAAGRLPPAQIAQYDQHLCACIECRTRYERLQNSFVKILRQASHAQKNLLDPDRALVAALIDHLHALPGSKPPNRTPPPTRAISVATPTPARRATPRGGWPEPPGYQILEVIGQGGMGVVYRAEQLLAGRQVALKMIVSGEFATTSEEKRFQKEAEAIAALDHPNIVRIYEVGDYEGRLFFSMEYCEGGDLARRIQRSPLPARDAATLVREVSDAMGAAHLANIIHRDLKPSNILISADGEPKVTDFGLAKRLEQEDLLTQSGAILGTPNYMAPEQAFGDGPRVGPAADVFSLGAILYECLVGRPPFKGASVLETLEQVRDPRPVPPRELCPTVPRDLETICLKSLSAEPFRRYPTGAELAADLQRWLDGEPILARPVSGPERLIKWVRRNPGVSLLLGVITLLLVGGTLVSWALKNQADVRAAEATKAREQAVQNYIDGEKKLQGFLPVIAVQWVANSQDLDIDNGVELSPEIAGKALEFLLDYGEAVTDPPRDPRERARALTMASQIQERLQIQDFDRVAQKAMLVRRESTQSGPDEKMAEAVNRMTVARKAYMTRDFGKAREEFLVALQLIDVALEEKPLPEYTLQRGRCVLGIVRCSYGARNPKEALARLNEEKKFIQTLGEMRVRRTEASLLTAEYWVLYADCLTMERSPLKPLLEELEKAHTVYRTDWAGNRTSAYHAEVLCKCLRRLITARREAEVKVDELVKEVLEVNELLAQEVGKQHPNGGKVAALAQARRHTVIADTYAAAGKAELAARHARQAIDAIWEDAKADKATRKELRGMLESLAKAHMEAGSLPEGVAILQLWESIAGTDAGDWHHIGLGYGRGIRVLQTLASSRDLTDEEQKRLRELEAGQKQAQASSVSGFLNPKR